MSSSPLILGVSGSLRAQSFNTALLKAAAAFVRTDVKFEIASIAQIPLYDGDVEERDGIPPAVAQLKDRIAAADGVLIATPEYNNSIPGVLKNAIDWMSRPAADIPRVFGQRAIAIMGASAGPYGTILSQSAWLPVIRTLRMRPWFDGRLMVARSSSVFSATGELTDTHVREQLEKFVTGFVDFACGKQK